MRLFEIDSEILPATHENIQRAKDFLLHKWKERAVERGSDDPADLSSACKFASLFTQKLFGGEIQGNYHHQYNILPSGQKLDLTEPSMDLERIIKAGNDPYEHDDEFWDNPDHRDSMLSCEPRVNKWVKEFLNSNS